MKLPEGMPWNESLSSGQQPHGYGNSPLDHWESDMTSLRAMFYVATWNYRRDPEGTILWISQRYTNVYVIYMILYLYIYMKTFEQVSNMDMNQSLVTLDGPVKSQKLILWSVWVHLLLARFSKFHPTFQKDVNIFKTRMWLTLAGQVGYLWLYLLGDLEHDWISFPFSWEVPYPNWQTPSFSKGVEINHQPDIHWAMELMKHGLLPNLVSWLLPGELKHHQVSFGKSHYFD